LKSPVAVEAAGGNPVAEQAALEITDPFMRGIIEEISDDRCEGRGPGSRGDVMARNYLAIRMQEERVAIEDVELERVQSANLLGLIPGSDPELSGEVVVYTAHHDHLGIGTPGEDGDAIYNGAFDNATGVAQVLAIAKAIIALPEAPRRSVLVNLVGAEEQGRVVEPDQFADKGYFYRSDQFSSAKIGVPAMYLDTGTDFVDRPPNWGREQQDHYTEVNYHQPSDEYDPSWNLEGMIQDALLGYWTGLAIANADEMPTWTPGDEFEAARIEALKAAE
jgi:Zn-dependent M28 family amino/carboxypeptidase